MNVHKYSQSNGKCTDNHNQQYHVEIVPGKTCYTFEIRFDEKVSVSGQELTSLRFFTRQLVINAFVGENKLPLERFVFSLELFIVRVILDFIVRHLLNFYCTSLLPDKQLLCSTNPLL